MENHEKDIKALKNAGNIFRKLVTNKNIDPNVSSIEVKKLSFYIKKRLLLNNLNIIVRPGEIHGFLGPNGAGKTTTIKNIINAYVTRTKDSVIKIMGYDPSSVEAKKKIAYIPEYAAFPKHLNLIEYLTTMSRFSGFSKSESLIKAKDLIKILELEPFKHTNPNKFSSGMKKKVLLAQSLMTDPEVLIMDEPAANLDPSARNLFFNAIKDLSKTGISILISSHILSELEGLVDSITLINNGNIVYSGTLKKIQNKMSKNSDHKIRVYLDVKNQSDFIKGISKYKFKIKNDSRYLTITSESKDKIYKVLEFIAKTKMEITKIEFNKITLQDIYDKEFIK